MCGVAYPELLEECVLEAVRACDQQGLFARDQGHGGCEVSGDIECTRLHPHLLRVQSEVLLNHLLTRDHRNPHTPTSTQPYTQLQPQSDISLCSL